MDRDSRWLATSARILFWAALLFAFVMATLPQPPLVVATSDKVQHMLAFAALTLLMGLGWPRLALWRILVTMALIGALIEVVQTIPELHRDADVADWWADMGAVAAILLPLALVRAGRRRRDPAPAE
jgi:hypothetical protein